MSRRKSGPIQTHVGASNETAPQYFPPLGRPSSSRRFARIPYPGKQARADRARRETEARGGAKRAETHTEWTSAGVSYRPGSVTSVQSRDAAICVELNTGQSADSRRRPTRTRSNPLQPLSLPENTRASVSVCVCKSSLPRQTSEGASGLEFHVEVAPAETSLRRFVGQTMGRQRRAVMGSTNLPVLTHHCEARAGAHHLPGPRGTKQAATQDAKAPRRSTCDNDTMDQRPRAVKLKPTRHEKFKLPLISSSTGKTATHAGQCRTKRKLSPRDAQLAEHEQAKLVLGDSIDAHETASKSYKNEHWYTSPIGFGSKKSVLLAALKSRDPGGAGVITSKQLIQALQAPNFGLDEQQARSLLTEFDLQLLDEGAKVPYREFVRHLRLPDERPSQPGQDPTIFYQESYINQGDRLSFEFDKARKQRRAEAKSRILLVHINRIEAFSQHQQKVTEQHETMRLAAKALHRHAHFEQAFEEENRRLLIAQRLPKGMLGSPTAKMHHNVSKDSMFYVEPV
ncbi:hypothetical protein PHYSODRAFT_336840 [Phytophthora sojae]|uniref:EF-hand domain-containing protein n=1 Tax=Phytophthora sojae (strain P6497) TaxID=1094619 RepID=G4ZWN9_PHYSP|nr:hypothetical protein PHYSODRAFT_336840 [Phytophthora sojae]EGZ12413.1 hypothetical protein PHYSODRAFT_336840 [Phytophthora sojae]|eukprot:XP_009532746.1 hypothetical protein PHYSODRAFT_336840 [Phytophthora sojae]